MGSGKENIIKTNVALNGTEAKLILIEEPENHLSFDLSREQIKKIQSKDDRQIMITTHSPLIVSKLNLKNIKWINGSNKFVSLSKIDKEDADFFLKADNIDVLQVIIAEKVILVEGAAEYITIKNMIQQVYNKDSDELGIHIISMGGDLYKRFKSISNIVKNKILVITDNDHSEKRIEESHEYSDENFNVSMPNSPDNFTFEVSLFNINKSFFCSKNWGHVSTTDSWNKHNLLDKKLVWLLNNKAEAAFQYSEKFLEKNSYGQYVLDVPDYIKEGLIWLIK
ncbi:ATP-dependent nuclease [Lactobacillaceae bacterium Melli_B4]